MKEVLLLKCGEIVLKGLNRKTFEDRLLKNLSRRMKHVADCEISMRQSVVYVEVPEEADADAVMDCARRVFGFATISRAAVWPEKTLRASLQPRGPTLRCASRRQRPSRWRPLGTRNSRPRPRSASASAASWPTCSRMYARICTTLT